MEKVKKPLKLKIKKPLKVDDKKISEEKSEAILTSPEMSLYGGGGIKIIFQNAKIHAEKVIIRKVEK